MIFRSGITFHPFTTSPFPPCGGRLGWGVGAEGARLSVDEFTRARFAGVPLIPTLLPLGEKG
jgi:hypothetical protein